MTPPPGIGWTVETLRIHLEGRIDEQERAVAAALASAEKAIAKAEAAADKRFESVNEFRETLTDQAVTFQTRTEAEAIHRQIGDRLTGLADRLDRLEAEADRLRGTNAGLRVGWMTLVGVVALLGAFVSITVGLYTLLGR